MVLTGGTLAFFMKICPACGRTFDGDDDFCPDDGARLSRSAASVFDTPTTVIGTPARKSVAAGNGSKRPMLYVLVGAMAATIIALGFALYTYTGGTTEPTANAPANAKAKGYANTNQAKDANRPSSQTAPATQASEADPQAEESLTITEEDARGVLKRWLRAQNEQNFAAYRSLYHSSFVGYKDTPAGQTDRMGYAEWIRDRGKMAPNVRDVTVTEQVISAEGRTATVKFRQRWQSVRHCDIGAKTLTIQMFPDGPKITGEVLSNPYPC